MPPELSTAMQLWKQADVEAREAEAELAQAFLKLTACPNSEVCPALKARVSQARSRANDCLSVVLGLIGMNG